MKHKLIKQFTPEEKAAYRHQRYIQNRETLLARQKEYYEKNKAQIKEKANKRYRIKCGLKVGNANS